MSLSDKVEFHKRLRSLGYKSYSAYLQSSHWASIRRRYFEKYPAKKCHKCASGVGIQLHHRTYDRLGAEALTDFNVLCGKCHEACHALEHPSGSVMSTTRVFLRNRSIEAPVLFQRRLTRKEIERIAVTQALEVQPHRPRGLTQRKAMDVLAILADRQRARR